MHLCNGVPMNHQTEQATNGIASALGRIPAGLFVLTARTDDRRTGILASWVQQVCFHPPMVCVSVAKGRSIMPLISESRQFALCQLPQGERILTRKFSGSLDQSEDPFLGFDLLEHTVLHAPVLAMAMAYLECEVACHMDVDGDHDLFVGIVRGGHYNGGEPVIHLRDDGMHY
jgi:flavin reductase (DIM6/NTAB) family NADH-FMN oxidoreductase RutF